MTQPDTADQVLAIVRALAALDWPERYAGPDHTVHTSLEYERWVEGPRRRGVDPMWQAMQNEALGERGPTIRKAG